MNERLTLQDLIDILAKKQDITKKDAEIFLRELIAVISETIESNEPVKIKDFGVFKLVKVNARKSVDVNTGEAIEIPAHYKLSFTPDRLLKEAINRPFAHFESVVLEDGVTFDNVESEEGIVDETEDTDVTVDEEVATTVTTVESAISPADVTPELETDPILIEDESIMEEPDTIVEEEVIEEESQALEENEPKEDIALAEDTLADNSEATYTTGTDNIVDDKELGSDDEVDDIVIDRAEIKPSVAVRSVSTTSESDMMFENHQRKTKRRRFISLAFIVFLIVAGFAIGGFYIQEIMGFFNGRTTVDDKHKTVLVFPAKTVADSLSVLADSVDAAIAKEGTVEEKTVTTQTVAADKNTPLGTETIQSGQTLRLISLKYYGHKSFWPYIYDENKSKIKNPNNIPLGTKLVIPSPAKYSIDAKNKESVEKAKALESKIITEMGL